MELKHRVWPVVEVLLRVPPIFVMDAVLGTDRHWTKDYLLKDNYSFSADGIALSILWCIIYVKVFLTAFCVSLLSVELLLTVYLWIATFSLVSWSCVRNVAYLYAIGELCPEGGFHKRHELVMQYFTSNVIFQCTMIVIFYAISKKLKINMKPILTLSCFLGPCFFGLLTLSSTAIKSVAFASVITLCIYVVHSFVDCSKTIYETLHDCVLKWRTVVRHYGIYNLLEHHWLRLHIPKVLRIFWTLRLVEHAIVLLSNIKCDEGQELIEIFKQLLSSGCDTTIAVLGMTGIISSLCCYLGHAIQTLLHVEDADDSNLGTVSAALFLILAMQTGLTNLQPDKRLLRLYHIICLLFTAFLHFVHKTVNPLLLSLSATKSASLSKHIRALTVCALLVIFPSWFVIYLWSNHAISTWLLAVTIFSVEVVVKAMITLLLYVLSLIDTRHMEMWEELDTYVYYIRASGNAIEFFFSIFLFFNGAWMFIFESGGTIRACMICFHAYFNIWLQAKGGWSIVMKRKAAMKKIDALPEATSKQLRDHNDVCAICYQDMKAARITSCNHYYHGACLWKWLYVQDLCPLCQKCLYTTIELQERGFDGREAELDFNIIDWEDDY